MFVVIILVNLLLQIFVSFSEDRLSQEVFKLVEIINQGREVGGKGEKRNSTKLYCSHDSDRMFILK